MALDTAGPALPSAATGFGPGMSIAPPTCPAVRAADEGRLTRAREALRSEEHTSELQSLMRISYAVFCLKKKIKRGIQIRYTTYNNKTTKSHETTRKTQLTSV